MRRRNHDSHLPPGSTKLSNLIRRQIESLQARGPTPAEARLFKAQEAERRRKAEMEAAWNLLAQEYRTPALA